MSSDHSSMIYKLELFKNRWVHKLCLSAQSNMLTMGGDRISLSIKCISSNRHTVPLGWKGLRIYSAVCRYSHKIHDIRAPNHTEIMPNALHCLTPLRATIAHASCALVDVTNIEFSMLHMALPNASTAQRRWDTTMKYVWYASIDLVHCALHSRRVKWCGGSVKWHANSVRTWSSGKCATSLRAACALREPFYPGLPPRVITRLYSIG